REESEMPATQTSREPVTELPNNDVFVPERKIWLQCVMFQPGMTEIDTSQNSKSNIIGSSNEEIISPIGMEPLFTL
ncbi:MAG: hypothetical protein NTW79_00565, partial [Candidatus Berkelbacteria bacterium]|nr:hypothetical protein [Candidatus Berkelbacteria bacterium]